MQTRASGIDSAPPGHSEEAVTVVSHGGSEAEQCLSAAMVGRGVGVCSLILEGA